MGDLLRGADGFAPDLRLGTAERGSTRIAELMRTGRPLLLDLADSTDLRAVAAPWHDRVSIVTASADDPPAEALLIRPDGQVAWTAPPATADDLRDALHAWCGPV